MWGHTLLCGENTRHQCKITTRGRLHGREGKRMPKQKNQFKKTKFSFRRLQYSWQMTQERHLEPRCASYRLDFLSDVLCRTQVVSTAPCFWLWLVLRHNTAYISEYSFGINTTTHWILIYTEPKRFLQTDALVCLQHWHGHGHGLTVGRRSWDCKVADLRFCTAAESATCISEAKRFENSFFPGRQKLGQRSSSGISSPCWKPRSFNL